MLKNKKLTKELSGLKKKLKDLADYNCDCENCQGFRLMLSDFKKSELREIVILSLKLSQDKNYSEEYKKFSSYIG